MCWECQIEDELPGWLCDEHRETHPHDNYDEPCEIVNSPRMGFYGYTRPAEDPNEIPLLSGKK
jgi:hypothetical protein